MRYDGIAQLCSMERDKKTAKDRKGAGRKVPTLETVQLESSRVYKSFGKFGVREVHLPGRAQPSKVKLNSKHKIISNQLSYSRTLEPQGISRKSESWAWRQSQKSIMCPGGKH